MPISGEAATREGASAEDETAAAGHSRRAYSAPAHASAGRMLLRLLRATQPASRVELAQRLGVSRSTVTDTFKPLIAAGVLREGPAAAAPGEARQTGRPRTALYFNGDDYYFVGVNIGVRTTHVGLATLGGEALAEDEFDTPADPSDALALIREATGRLCSDVAGRRLRGIGVSVPGPTDAGRRRLLYAPHLGWHGVDVAGALRFGEDGCAGGGSGAVPVLVENDSTAAAVYEARLRLRDTAGDLPDSFILVRSGTGLGVGLVLGGEIYRGAGRSEGAAGEFGHMTIVAGGKPCVCGNRGCWERYASASSASSLYTGDRAHLGGTKAPRFAEIVARAEAGELRARRTLERVGEYLGIGIANVIIGLGVPRVILSGRVVLGWNYIREPLHNAAAQSMAGRLSGWYVEPGEPRGAGLGGALEVAIEGYVSDVLQGN